MARGRRYTAQLLKTPQQKSEAEAQPMVSLLIEEKAASWHSLQIQLQHKYSSM
jgi:hypothetical protein